MITVSKNERNFLLNKHLVIIVIKTEVLLNLYLGPGQLVLYLAKNFKRVLKKINQLSI